MSGIRIEEDLVRDIRGFQFTLGLDRKKREQVNMFLVRLELRSARTALKELCLNLVPASS
jgi:hypothetical protein